MTDSMKFGPEWLRNLSADGNTGSSSGGGARYQLAEHRYGREEMLALFEQSQKLRPPASIMDFHSLYADQALNPLALAPMTDDENRLWTGRAIPPGVPRGRGGSMERGRGRGRGGTYHSSFNRSSSLYEEPVRPYDRLSNDRVWTERNGEINDWSGSSPRKEFIASRGTSMDNWRRQRGGGEDDDTWRSSGNHARPQEKWARNSGNWRDGELGRDEGHERQGHQPDRPGNNRPHWQAGGGDATGRGPPYRKPWDLDDHLPEWATENPSESGGTFDSTGAFHDDDEAAEALRFCPKPKGVEVPPKFPLKQTPTLPKQTEQIPDSVPEKKKLESKPRDTVCPETPKASPPPEENVNHLDSSATKPQEHLSPAPNVSFENGKVKPLSTNGLIPKDVSSRKLDDEFDHMKEVTDDIVAKLILDDELPKTVGGLRRPYSNSIVMQAARRTPIAEKPPASLPTGNGQDQWYYRDPQGQVQGPFPSTEMNEWMRAGYFNLSLLVRRQCDEHYFTLMDLVKQSNSQDSFLSCRLPPLKSDPAGLAKLIEQSEMSFRNQQQLQMKRLLQQQMDTLRALNETEPWTGTPHIPPQQMVNDVPPHLQSTHVPNPLIEFISQLQQGKKPPIVEPPKTLPTQHLDPLQQLVQQMGGLQSSITPNLAPNLTPSMAPNMTSNMAATMAPNLTPNLTMPTQNTPAMDNSTTHEMNPIKNLLQQLAKQQQQTTWSIYCLAIPQWIGTPGVSPAVIQPSSSMLSGHPPLGLSTSVPVGLPGVAAGQPSMVPTPMSGITQPGVPSSLWDLHSQPPPMSQSLHIPTSMTAIPQTVQALPPPIIMPVSQTSVDVAVRELNEEEKHKIDLELMARKKAALKERVRKDDELQEKLKAQREAEEKRKEEQKKREAEKKAELERQRKEEERNRKELEKIRKEQEDKRMKELEEKRKLKELRKLEDEAKKRAEEENRKKEEEEKQRRDAIKKEEQTRLQIEALRRLQETQQRTKTAPWCQAATGMMAGTSLAEIQKAEKEKRAEQAALLQLQQKEQEKKLKLEQKLAAEKATMQLKWATKKNVTPKKVKSLAEIQQEEQERAAQQMALAKLTQSQKEKETATTYTPPVGIWGSSNQSLIWSNTTTTPSWEQSSGFWDDAYVAPKPVRQAPILKTSVPLVVCKPVQSKPAVKPVIKSKVKKEEAQVLKLFEKTTPNTDEFTAWCIKTLATLNSDVDIPTFVSFLRDIESPFEVKDYVKQYLGDTTQALQFANQFVERRSRVKDQQRAALQHKDDLCMPAPAINPSSNTEFQEVKGKGKKTKKSKMTKVDARCLGFSVTAAEGRINVGDRDYGDSL